MSKIIKGKYSNGKTSEQTEVALLYDINGSISIQGIDRSSVIASELKISSRLGNTPRYIRFSDDCQFETEDNDGVDRMIDELGFTNTRLSIYRLESAKRVVAITVLVVVAFGWLSVQYGIPALSKQIAFALPEVVSEKLGEGVFETMDNKLFDPSMLSEDKRSELQKMFKGLVKKINNPPPLKLIFRDAGVLGANAFALPNGVIVITDDMVKMNASNMEIGSVMLHEIGHVQQRHSLRLATQGFGLAVLVMLFTSDVSTSSSVITSIPLLLVESGYSQSMEWEADGYALDYMLNNKIDPIHFSNMMRKLENFHANQLKCIKSEKSSAVKNEECAESSVSNKSADKNDSLEEQTITDYFSSHPATIERINRFKAASRLTNKPGS